MHLQIQFRGGPRDGEVVSADIPSAACSEAEGLYRWTEGCRVGSRVWCPSLFAAGLLQTHGWMWFLDSIDRGCCYPGHVYEVCWNARLRDERMEVKLSYCGPEE